MNIIFKVILCFLAISCLSCPTINCFQTVDELRSYASSISESPQPDNNNWLKPDYKSYFKNSEPTFFNTLVASLKKLFSRQVSYVLDPKLTQKLLIDLIISRENAGYSGQFVLASRPTANATIVIWTDLLGAFHSLVRDLEELHKKQIINNNLEIIKEHCFFVFNGNTLGSSPSAFELLTLIMVLMQKNPDKVFYLKGPQEKHEAWQDTTLSQQLVMRAPTHRYVTELINRFFNTLPEAFYLQAFTDVTGSKSNNSPQLVRISAAYQRQVDSAVLEKLLSSLPEGSIKKFALTKQKSKSPVDALRVVIANTNRDIVYTPTDGLQLLSGDQGVTAWLPFAGGSEASAKLFEFNNDAFVTLATAPSLKNWTISLHKQDRHSQPGFQTRSFNLLTGHEIGLKKTPAYKQEVIFGCTLDLTKTLATLAKEVQKGLELFVHKRNQDPLDERYIKLIFLNDEYTPRLTLKKAQEFLKNFKTNLFLSPFGTSTTQVFLPMVIKKEVLVMFPYTGASIFRKPDLTHILHVRTSYDNEARALVNYAINTLRAEKFALFYQDDSFGHSPLKAAREALQKVGVHQIIEAPYMRNSTNMEKPAKQIIEFDPDVIIFFSVYAPSTELIRKIGIDHLTSKILMSISSLSDAFKEFVQAKGLELINSHVLPNPRYSTLPIVKEYREDMARWHKERDFTSDSLEGYVNAQILGYLLHRIKDQVTMDALIEQAEAIKNFDFKGLTLNFNPETRELLSKVWIDTGEESWLAFNLEEQQSKKQNEKYDHTQKSL